MPRPVPSWKLGLKPDIDLSAVYEGFRVLLSEHLPMSQDELATALGRNRTTVSKWKSKKASEPRAALRTQRQVIEAVRKRLRAIEQQVVKVEGMLDALHGVEAAYKELTEKHDHQSVDGLAAAKDRVRDLLDPADG